MSLQCGDPDIGATAAKSCLNLMDQSMTVSPWHDDHQKLVAEADDLVRRGIR